jgi:hypothetical protein
MPETTSPAQPSQPAAGLECSGCPAIPLLELTEKLLAMLHELLDDLPAAECQATASFNLSNQPPRSRPKRSKK